MQLLIAVDAVDLSVEPTTTIVDIVRVIEKIIPLPSIRKPKKPPEPELQPDQPSRSLTTGGSVALLPTEIVAEEIGTEKIDFGLIDGPVQPLVKVMPRYPDRAAKRGLSGWVVVEFMVTEAGSVKNPQVVAHCAWQQVGIDECFESPSSIFDQSALKAVRKFKYQPKVVDGQTIPAYGVQNRILFALTKG